jgi:hypothetical protein
MEISPEYICKDALLGSGTYKQAFTVNICDAGTENAKSDFSSNIDPSQLCIVEFKEPIEWINPGANFKSTIENLINDYNIKHAKLIIKAKISGRVDELPKVVLPKDCESFFKTIYPSLYNINNLIEWFDEYKTQFDSIDELKKMHKLGSFLEGPPLGGGGGGAPQTEHFSFAPTLFQIRIDHVTTQTNPTTKKIENRVTNFGNPFFPNEIDAKLEEIRHNTLVQISYLAEKCGEPILEYLQNNYNKKDAIGKKVNDFVDSFIDKTKELNSDFKIENVCPKYSVDQQTKQSIQSIQLLDVDPEFSIFNNTDPDFLTHAKVFMKFLFFSYSDKYKTWIKFPNWFVTKKDVESMIKFFYKDHYMKTYKFNPISMLYHYLIANTTEPYNFLSYDDLKELLKTDAEIVAVFQPSINFIPPPETKGGKKRKSRRRKNTRKLMKNRQPLSSRKNNQA